MTSINDPATARVEDLAPHLDLFDPAHSERLWEVLAYARSQCPVLKTDADDGYYIVTRYDDLRTVLEDPETYSSVQAGLRGVPILMPPLTEDPPRHIEYRRALNKYLSRSFLGKFADDVRETARELLDKLVPHGQFDFMTDYAVPFTSRNLARVILDDGNAERIQRAISIATRISGDGEAEAFFEIAALAEELLRERAASGSERDDVLSAIVQRNRPGTPAHHGRAGRGDDHPVHRRPRHDQGRARQHRPSPRRAPRPSKSGCATPTGSRQTWTSSCASSPRSCSWRARSRATPSSAAARSRRATGWRSTTPPPTGTTPGSSHADELNFDRERNPHAAFGLGPHRCIGLHFARLQIEIAFSELLSRVTNLRIPPGAPGGVGGRRRADPRAPARGLRRPRAAAVTGGTAGRPGRRRHRRRPRPGPQSRARPGRGGRQRHRARRLRPHRDRPLPAATKEDLEDTAEQVAALGGRVIHGVVDVRDLAGMERFVGDAVGDARAAGHRLRQRGHQHAVADADDDGRDLADDDRHQPHRRMEDLQGDGPAHHRRAAAAAR